MKPEWFTEDGTFIGPWWTRWAFLAIALGVPVAWVASTGVIVADDLVAWAIFLAALNMFRAKGFYEPVVRLFRAALRRFEKAAK